MKHISAQLHCQDPKGQIHPTLTKEIRDLIGKIYLPSVDAAYLDPDTVSSAIVDAVAVYYGSPKSSKLDVSQVSDAAFESVVLVERPISRLRVRRMQGKVKQLWFWSAADMAEFLGISRAQLKRIESGTRPIGEKFERHFRLLERRLIAWQKENKAIARQLTVITSPHRLPSHLEILARPVKCDVCSKYFTPIQPRQKRHRGCRRKR